MEIEERKHVGGSEENFSQESKSDVADNSKTFHESVAEINSSTNDELKRVDKEENVEEEKAEKDVRRKVEKSAREKEEQEEEKVEEGKEVEKVKGEEEEAIEKEEKIEEEETDGGYVENTTGEEEQKEVGEEEEQDKELEEGNEEEKEEEKEKEEETGEEKEGETVEEKEEREEKVVEEEKTEKVKEEEEKTEKVKEEEEKMKEQEDEEEIEKQEEKESEVVEKRSGGEDKVEANKEMEGPENDEAVNKKKNREGANPETNFEEPLSSNPKEGEEEGVKEEEEKIEEEEKEEKERGEEKEVERRDKEAAEGEEANEKAANRRENRESVNQEPHSSNAKERANPEECEASDDSTIPRDPAFDVRIVEEKLNSVCIDWMTSPEAEVYKIEKYHRRLGWEQVAWVGYAPATTSDLAENFTYRLRIKAQRFCEAHGQFKDYKMSPDFLVTTLSPLPTTLSLHRAIKKGQQFLVKRILRRRPSLLEYPGPNGYLPLANAIIDGQNSVIDVLLSHGGNVQIGNPLNTRTPLQLAFYYGRLAVARILLNRKAQLEAVDINGMTACHFAVDANQLELLRFALENGASVNATDACGWSLLSRAVYNSPFVCSRNGLDVCILKLLLTHGADAKSRDKMGKTCMDLAKIYKNTVAAEFLAKALRPK